MRVFPAALAVRSIAALVACCATPAIAQDASPPPNPQTTSSSLAADTLTVGVAAVYLTDYEGSDDYRFVPAPGAIGSYKGYSFQLAGNRLSADLIRTPSGPGIDLQAGPLAVVNFDRSNVDNIDSARVRALGERDTAIEIGGYVGIGKTGVITSEYDQLSATLSYRTDVAGAHGGGIWQPSVSYFTPLSTKAAVGLFGSLEHVSGDYARYYFTIDPTAAAASGLPAFDADGGWKNYTLGVIGTYALTGDLLHGVKVVAGGTYKRMLGDFGDSPIVSQEGSRGQWLLAAGLAYTF